jgi:flavin reductase (DIM6/NTAB) family NADH-FMN oxidoreductase RutF
MTIFYEPRNGHGLPHDPFNSIVGPRPIGWVSTKSASGILNLAPYSFFNAFNYVPPIVGFCIIHPSHFGGFTTEAIVTGSLTAIISLMLNWLGKKLFIHGRDKLLKH